MLNVFSKNAMMRIQNAVKSVEAEQAQQHAQRRNWPLGGNAKPGQLYIASEDIDQNAIGNGKTATATAWDSAYSPTGDDIAIVNAVTQKIWEGSSIIGQRVNVVDAGAAIVAMQTNAATILHGTLDTETASTIWNVDIVGPVNGFYSTTASGAVAKSKVFMPHANDELIEDQNVFILHDPTKTDSDDWQWVVISADCIPESP